MNEPFSQSGPEDPIPGDSIRRGAVNSYFDAAAKEYGENSEKGAWAWLKNAEYNAVASQLGSITGLVILDAGCGAGWYAKRLALQKPKAYVALDALFSMVVRARDEGMDALVADSQSLPFKPVFDVVLCAGALEFMESPPLFFLEAARVLRPGGQLTLLAPTNSAPGKLYRWWHGRHGFDIHLFGEEDLASMASSAGLRLESLGRAGIFNLAARMRKPG
ncbi:MAG: class I SAM-dependent methyltransferase [Nitrospinota bacterium]|nr:class I SAM-dependent methyltransferase [Nitrospinota bacterium]MDH5678947.1 class I SAM-dependent methyltransferase [Nitrospinota bacterium]MDH5755114.1 class I SAM-dependent methyltransferase [Nitrospinota bacterium]